MLARCLPTELQSNRDTEEGKVTEHCNPESETKERKKRKKRRVTQHAIVDPPGPPGEKGENQSCTFVSDSFRNSELGRQKLLLALTEQLVPRKRADATLARNVIRHIAGNGHPAGIERDLLAAAAACRGADNPWAMFASRVQAAPFGYRPAGRRSGT